MNQPMNQPTTPDLSNYGAQVIKESGRFALTYWPYCTKCKSPFQFDAEEPFAYCSCGTTEWGDPRPASWVCSPRQPLNEKVNMDDKTEQDLTGTLRFAAKSAMYKTAMIAPSYLIAAADTIDDLRAQLAEARRDSERLDWMIEQCAYVVSDPDCCDGYWLRYQRPDGTVWVQATEHATPRAAIDAAMGEPS